MTFQVSTQASTTCYCPAGMFELLFVDIDWHVRVNPMHEAAGMVQIEMTKDHHFMSLISVPMALVATASFFFFSEYLTQRKISVTGADHL